MSEQLDNPFDPFADAVEESLRSMREEIRSLRTELQTRAVPVIQTPEPIDIDAIATRAAALVPVPVAPAVDVADIAQRAASLIPAPKDGEDGIATREEIEAVVRAAVAEMQVRTFADLYQGVYKPDTNYSRGVFSTWGGSLWLSKIETRNKPGEGSDWVLVVKRGADARK